jgi:hypothetical protein
VIDVGIDPLTYDFIADGPIVLPVITALVLAAIATLAIIIVTR